MGRIFPWISILLITYVACIIGGLPIEHAIVEFGGGPGRTFGISAANLMILAGCILLIVEMVLAAMHFSYRTLANHVLSLLAFVVGVALFIAVSSLRSATLLEISGLMLVDLAAGIWVTIMVSRRLVSLESRA